MPANPSILIRLSDQKLILSDAGRETVYDISSARNGAGQRSGSYQTPLGRHVIRAKIGQGESCGAVFVGRRSTGEVYSPELSLHFPQRDWILSRILWLSGLDKGFNRLGEVDTMRRYIYIHGTPDTEPMGIPASHGCIRMRNADVIELFDRVNIGTPVEIIS